MLSNPISNLYKKLLQRKLENYLKVISQIILYFAMLSHLFPYLSMQTSILTYPVFSFTVFLIMDNQRNYLLNAVTLVSIG